MSFLSFFTDPVLRAPTWGCLLMSIASALMGVPILLKKRSLLSETLSHATYPGVVVGVFVFAALFPQGEDWVFLAVLGGAFLFALLALFCVNVLEKRCKVSSDASLSFVLSLFFGAGIVGASVLQAIYPKWQKQVQMLLFGQAATMNDTHIVVYGCMALLVSCFLCLVFRPLQAFLFDRDFAASIKLRTHLLEQIFVVLLLFSLIIGIRSVGVVLLSGMVIAPAVAARQFSNRLQVVLCLAALFGALSGLFGNILSVWSSVPTGPAIVLVGTLFALVSLLFAPRRGLVFRIGRISSFRFRCLRENILKGLWRKGATTWPILRKHHPIFFPLLKLALWRLKRYGLLIQRQGAYELTSTGKIQASHIVRLHRLWELYLAQSLGFELAHVHHTAEEMEHILTPEIEKELTALLKNPKQDPHHQPIPEKL